MILQQLTAVKCGKSADYLTEALLEMLRCGGPANRRALSSISLFAVLKIQHRDRSSALILIYRLI